MKFVIQRVAHAKVTVNETITGAIDKGFLVLIGVSETDTKEIADKMIKKLVGMRIFEDENEKTNLSLTDVGGSLLLVSQFHSSYQDPNLEIPVHKQIPMHNQEVSPRYQS